MSNIVDIQNIFPFKIKSLEKVKLGYSREVYVVNSELILKIPKNAKSEQGSKKEVDFHTSHQLPFAPKIIKSDFSRTIVPFPYYVEEKAPGVSLMSKWKMLSEDEKEAIMNDLLCKLDVIHRICDSSLEEDNLIDEFNDYLGIAIDNGVLTEEQIAYLKELGQVIPSLVEGRPKCIIHGDFHFGNVIVDENNNCKIIDFELIRRSYLEREFDPLSRMTRNPNSLIDNSSSIAEDIKKYSTIMRRVFAHYNEIDSEDFSRLLLLFDCINSLRWFPMFPDYPLYNEILFNKSKKLTKI